VGSSERRSNENKDMKRKQDNTNMKHRNKKKETDQRWR
jgi:hypothetical protein